MDGHHRVRGPGCRLRVGIAGGHVHRAVARINGRRVPDRRSSSGPELRAGRVRSGARRRVRDRVRLPDLPARGGVEGDDAPAERTAGVVEAAARGLLARGHRHVEPALVQRGSAGDDSEWMRVHVDFPPELTGRGIHGVDVGADIAEVGGVPRGLPADSTGASGADADSVANAGLREEGPVDTSGCGIQRVHVARIDADKDTAARHRGLAIDRRDAGKPERPLQRQPRHVGR